jgi:hypothetical protein
MSEKPTGGGLRVRAERTGGMVAVGGRVGGKDMWWMRWCDGFGSWRESVDGEGVGSLRGGKSVR